MPTSPSKTTSPLQPAQKPKGPLSRSYRLPALFIGVFSYLILDTGIRNGKDKVQKEAEHWARVTCRQSRTCTWAYCRRNLVSQR
ncbi:hypothetical protein K491DRAFT_692144 [Lophiostoma macrostomum CBS 122681]|uniref:Uncharacterized protein n=1 Tax=Lophiostoma macrostomum CBS 122681 TaxID=1314788 RepID=A0A6A6T8X1_9PLEO|nr:hypothetical protein K491DRAFT_692144 [Lophiostoma macrostomum CBS 122681]